VTDGLAEGETPGERLGLLDELAEGIVLEGEGAELTDGLSEGETLGEILGPTDVSLREKSLDLETESVRARSVVNELGVAEESSIAST
jgi:hypothetical protein